MGRRRLGLMKKMMIGRYFWLFPRRMGWIVAVANHPHHAPSSTAQRLIDRFNMGSSADWVKSGHLNEDTISKLRDC